MKILFTFRVFRYIWVIDSGNLCFIHILTLQRLEFASAVGKYQGFSRGISMFFSICLSKKNADAIEFLGLIKKTLFQELKKMVFKERNVLLNKKTFVCLIKSFLFFT